MCSPYVDNPGENARLGVHNTVNTATGGNGFHTVHPAAIRAWIEARMPVRISP
jgi:hypothetical protein